MPTLSPDALLERLHWRYAVKAFDPTRPVPPERWAALEQALVLSPSSFGFQPWRFTVVTNAEVKRRLRAVSYAQPQIEACSHLTVFAARRGMGPGDAERWVARNAEVRGVPASSLEGFRQSLLKFVAKPKERLDAWCDRQTYVALGVFLASAAALGVDACPMEGIDPVAYDEILGLAADGYGALCVAAAGTRAADDPAGARPKVRYAPADVVRHVA